jgi:hypothetical protein
VGLGGGGGGTFSAVTPVLAIQMAASRIFSTPLFGKPCFFSNAASWKERERGEGREEVSREGRSDGERIGVDQGS